MGCRLIFLLVCTSCAVGCVHEESADSATPFADAAAEAPPAPLAPATTAPPTPLRQAIARTLPKPPPPRSPFANVNRCVANFAEQCILRIVPRPNYAVQEISITAPQHARLEECFQSAAYECFAITESEESDSIEEEEEDVRVSEEPEVPPPVSVRGRPGVIREAFD